MMSKIFLASDWHLVKYDKESGRSWKRPDIGIVKSNLAVVKREDSFIFLGDLQDSEIEDKEVIKEVLNVLPKETQKILIRGNNDCFGDQAYLDMGFDEVLWALPIRFRGLNILLSHTSVNVANTSWYNVHGHIHRPGVNVFDIPYYHDPHRCHNICNHRTNNADIYDIEEIVFKLKHITKWGTMITGKTEKPGMSQLCQHMAEDVLRKEMMK